MATKGPSRDLAAAVLFGALVVGVAGSYIHHSIGELEHQAVAESRAEGGVGQHVLEVKDAVIHIVRGNNVTFPSAYPGKRDATCGLVSYTDLRGVPRLQQFVETGEFGGRVLLSDHPSFGDNHRKYCE